jgi:hypothetical protein
MIVPLAIRRLDHAPHQPGYATILRKHLVARAPSLYKHLPDKAALEAAIIATGCEDAAAAFEAVLERRGDPAPRLPGGKGSPAH